MIQARNIPGPVQAWLGLDISPPRSTASASASASPLALAPPRRRPRRSLSPGPLFLPNEILLLRAARSSSILSVGNPCHTNMLNRVNLSKLCDGTDEGADDASSKSASSSSSTKCNISVGSECEETVVRLLSQIPSHCSDIYDLFREDKTVEGKDIRKLCSDQLNSATDLYLKFYQEGYTVTYQYLGGEINKMMKVNIDKLLPLLRSSGYAHEMLVDLDRVLCRIRLLIMRGGCLKDETWSEEEK